MNYSDYNVSFGIKPNFLNKIKQKIVKADPEKNAARLAKIKQTAEKKSVVNNIFERHNINVDAEDIFVDSNKAARRKKMDAFYSKISSIIKKP